MEMIVTQARAHKHDKFLHRYPYVKNSNEDIEFPIFSRFEEEIAIRKGRK